MRSLRKRLAEIPFVSVGLVSVNVVVYFLNEMWNDRLILAGNLNLLDVLHNREYVRIVRAMFLHADLNHLFNNMIILLFMGAMLERATGHIVFGSIYMLSGICGNICSLFYKLMSGSWSYSVGASGAVFGMDGLLLALVLLWGKKLPTVTLKRVLIMIVLSVYNGFVTANIDNAAHIGGLLSGFLMGCLFCAGHRVWQSCRYYKKNRM